MKKPILLFLIVLFLVPNVYADRISPTENIGLFIDPDLYLQSFSSLLKDAGYSIISRETTKEYIGLGISNGTAVMLGLNNCKKIDHISIHNYPASNPLENLWNSFILAFYSTGLYDSIDDATNYLLQFSNIGERGFPFNENNFTMYFEYDGSIGYFFEIISPLSRRLVTPSGCDSNYVGACVPKTNKNLDCKDIGIKNFFVVGKDSHYFDGDKNGVCCEPFPNIQHLP